MRPALAALLVVCACKAEVPSTTEKLVATPDKSQPVVAVRAPATPQQVRPERVELRSEEEKKERSAPPDDFEDEGSTSPGEAIGRAIEERPGKVEMIEEADGTRLRGVAKSHEAVAKLMRTLNGLVQTPNRGLGRVVERKEGAATARVELLDKRGTVIDYFVSEVPPLQVTLVKANLQKDGQVAFEILLKVK